MHDYLKNDALGIHHKGLSSPSLCLTTVAKHLQKLPVNAVYIASDCNAGGVGKEYGNVDTLKEACYVHVRTCFHITSSVINSCSLISACTYILHDHAQAKALLIDNYGKDLATVEALIRKHEELERDISAIDTKLEVHMYVCEE